MRLRRRPDPVLLGLFDRAGTNARTTCVLLRDMVRSFPESSGLGEQIRDREHEGDRIAHEILLRLAQRGARRTHLDAVDVHALVVAIDDVADHAEEAADQLGRYGVEASLEAAEGLADLLVAAADRVAESLHEFGEGADVTSLLVEIHRLEKQADRLVRDSITSLFAAGIDPMMVIRWKDILETLEAAVDACEAVANVLEGISLKHGGRPVAFEP